MGENKPLLVLGCGKSLAKYPFNLYQNIDTLGMNNAYRYWHKIGWYPTYYCCLDKMVSRYFYNDIKKLIKNREKYGIKKFFLSEVFAKMCPKYRNFPGIYYINQLNYSHIKGFSGDSQVTTGSFSVRFGIFLGYQKIYLLGIDAYYKPINIDWVNSITDSNMILKKTVDPEPDYFFIGYRQKGDHFHLPPQRRWKNRYNHLSTFKKINQEFNQNKSKIVINSSPDSMLHKANILPYQQLPSKYTNITKDSTKNLVQNKSLTKNNTTSLKKSDKKQSDKKITKKSDKKKSDKKKSDKKKSDKKITKKLDKKKKKSNKNKSGKSVVFRKETYLSYKTK